MRAACAVALVIACFLVGVREGVLQEQAGHGPTAFVIGVAISLFIAGWCWLDGRVRGKPLARVAPMLILAAPMVGYPIYCVWSRGLRGLLLLVISVIVYSCVYAFSATLTTILVHGLDSLPQ